MYKIKDDNSGIERINKTTFAELGMKERQDLQEWIFSSPEILGEERELLFMIAKELPVNDISKSIRLDLLALDRDGSLVVIELKRNDTRGDIDWQAIKYASRCSNFDPDDVLELYCNPKYSGVSMERVDAIKKMLEHVEGDFPMNDEDLEIKFREMFRKTEGGKLSVRILLVAQNFHPDICAAVLWLRDNGIDIGCIRLTPFKPDIGRFIDVERIIPIPETQDYTEHAIKRKKSEEAVGYERSKRKGVFGADQNEDLNSDELEKHLRTALERDTNLTKRLIKFLKVLSNAKGEYVGRVTVLHAFVEDGLATDIGYAGRLLSNVSQFITKRGNSFLRTIIEYKTASGADLPGERKEEFRIKKQYLSDVEKVLASLPGN